MTNFQAGVLVVGILLLAGCQGGRPSVTYQPADASSAGQPQRWSVDGDPVGSVPAGMTVFSGSWNVRAESDTPSRPNALCQTGTAQFPALALGQTVYANIVLSARVKAISGREDQAAGLIVRVQNRDNYYILRANALENNVNLYTYAGGQRSLLKEGAAKVAAGQWHELRFEARGNRLSGFLNNQQVVETTDDTYAAGQIGLWTKADSVTCFDDVEARSP